MLACPLCSAPLNAVDNGVACPAGHRFDRARQGYLNLLPVQHKNSRDPGDNLAMVEARRDFLNAGHYAFSDICAIIPMFDDCDGDAGGWINIEQAHRITQTLVTAHFGVHLVGDDRFAPWLEAATLSAYPELVWTLEE